MKLIWCFRQLLMPAGLLLTMCGIVRAEHLPLKPYTVADGLPNNAINKIVGDSRGFLWFCTDDGLACVRDSGKLISAVCRKKLSKPQNPTIKVRLKSGSAFSNFRLFRDSIERPKW